MTIEFRNLDGGIQTLDNVLINDVPSIADIKVIYHPVKEIFYKDEKVLYQVCEFCDLLSPFVIVIGYKKSEEYTVKGTRAGKIEIIKDEDKKELEKIIKKNINDSWSINFYGERK